MKTFSALLAICAGNSPVTRPVTRSFDVFFDLRLDKRLNKQSWGWWFETPSGQLWRHCNVTSVQETCWKLWVNKPHKSDKNKHKNKPKQNTTNSSEYSIGHYRHVTWASGSFESLATRLFVQELANNKGTSKHHIPGHCEGNPPITALLAPLLRESLVDSPHTGPGMRTVFPSHKDILYRASVVWWCLSLICRPSVPPTLSALTSVAAVLSGGWLIYPARAALRRRGWGAK